VRTFLERPYADSTSEIFLARIDGTGEGRLTDTPGEDWLPAWSPNP